MKNWLLKNLVQDVPDELSVCEFDCRKSICRACDRAECELLQQASVDRKTVSQNIDNSRTKEPDFPAKWQPVWLYEVMPFAYLLCGLASIYYFDSLIGYVVGGPLLIAALHVWVMRFKYRAMNTLPLDNANFTHHADR